MFIGLAVMQAVRPLSMIAPLQKHQKYFFLILSYLDWPCCAITYSVFFQNAVWGALCTIALFIPQLSNVHLTRCIARLHKLWKRAFLPDVVDNADHDTWCTLYGKGNFNGMAIISTVLPCYFYCITPLPCLQNKRIIVSRKQVRLLQQKFHM